MIVQTTNFLNRSTVILLAVSFVYSELVEPVELRGLLRPSVALCGGGVDGVRTIIRQKKEQIYIPDLADYAVI